MKWLLSFIFLSFSCYVFSQHKTVSFSSIDSRAEDVDASSPDTLACLLTLPYTTELEKVRSIFHWITEHISYNTIHYQRAAAYTNDNIEADYDADTVFKSLDERVARITLRRRYALCDGY